MADRPPPRRKFSKHLVENYDVDALVGQGAFSTVWRCVHRASGQVRALKKIDTSELSPREIAHEIALMRYLRHNCVVRCYDVFLENQFVNIVVDLFTGGDLVDGLNAHRKARGRLPDGQLAHLSRQMMSAVAHVHSMHIIHRDIKGENFLADRPDIGDPQCRVALADFGTAMRIDAGEVLKTKVGTPAFWAPEIWEGAYSFPVDVWAVGVTTFILLTGVLPFDGGEAHICRRVPPGELPVSMPHFASAQCTAFVARCLEKDCRARLAAKVALEDPWMLTPPEELPVASPSRRAPEVDKKPSWCMGSLAFYAQGVWMGCWSGLVYCLEVLLAGGEEEPRTPRPSVGRAPAPESRRSPGTPVPTGSDIEKEITDLTKQISTSLLKRGRD